MIQDAAAGLIRRRYATVYGASPDLNFPSFRAHESAHGVSAALGYRRADSGTLFLESYLDHPIEEALSGAIGRPFERRDIVEIGNMAADNAVAMIALWALAANDLGGRSEIAVAVLTAPLRAMFHRLGVALHEILPARPERIGDAARGWGTYYATNPIVCAGFIDDGQDRLARFARRHQRTIG